LHYSVDPDKLWWTLCASIITLVGGGHGVGAAWWARAGGGRGQRRAEARWGNAGVGGRRERAEAEAGWSGVAGAKQKMQAVSLFQVFCRYHHKYS